MSQTTEVEQQADVGTSSSSAAAAPRIVGPDGLTNKERRLAKQAEKKKRAEGGAAQATSAASVEAPAKTTKRKQETDEAATQVNGFASEDVASAAEGEQEGEVEALSHKEQRKRRRLEKKGLLPALGSAEDATAEKREPLPERSPYAIWIGNLSFMTNAQRLQSWLEEKGLQGISRVHMPKGVKKFEQNRGFAYVDLPTAEAVQAGVALSEDHLEGRRLLIKSATDYTGRPALNPAMAALAQATPSAGNVAASTGAGAGPTPDEASPAGPPVITPGGGKTGLTKTAQKILRSQKHPAGPTLFVGNLSFNSTQEGLLELFERSAKAREGWTKSMKERKREEKREKRKADSLEAKKRRAERDAAKAGKAGAESGSDSDSHSDEEEEDKPKADAASSDDDDDSSSSSPEELEESSSSSDDDDDSSSSSSSSSDEEQDDAEEATPRGAGVRKVRMGTFEDTGKCKGFAFVDFFTPVYSTASLIDPHNYRLDGRELTLEFAGADAVRRGAPKTQRTGAAAGGGGGRGKWPSSRESLGHKPERRERTGGPRADKLRARAAAAPPAAATVGEETPASAAMDVGVVSSNPNHKENQAERRARREREGAAKGGYTRRAKPGAALANAQRGKVGIDTTGEAGTKVTFD